MERLTKTHYISGNGHYMACSELNSCCDKECSTCNHLDEIVERLAAYEDTGLTPKSVEAIKLHMMGKAISEITEFNGLPIDRLRELAEADKAGRVAVLPCKVGDTVIDQTFAENPTLMKNIRLEIAYESRCGIVFHMGYGIFADLVEHGRIRPVSEEAEKALEAMK